MNRTIIGFALLLALLLCGVLAQEQMERLHDPIAGQLDRAAAYALEEEWDFAKDLSSQARNRWQHGWHFSAALADHQPMEDIDSQFARLDVFARQEDALEYSSTCRELSRKIRAMADAHTLNWWNLF